MQPKKNSGGDILYWVIALVLLITGVAAPIGILMIVVKLLSGNSRRAQTSQAREQRGPIGARTTGWSPVPPAGPAGSRPGPAGSRPVPPNSPEAEYAPQAKASTRAGKPSRTGSEAALAAQERTSNIMIVVGAIVSFIFGVGETSELATQVLPALFSTSGGFGGALRAFLETVPYLCFLAAGLGALVVGLRRRKRNRRMRTLLAMIGKRKAVPISSLATATGLPAATVRDDLDYMLSCGVLPQGYLDFGSDRLILSGDGLLEEEESRSAPSGAGMSPENSILAEIREVNQMVDNERLSAQIDRIGVITSRILDYQRSHPEQSTQLHSFLSYYLPTTLKILRAYAQLEDQEVSGENISSAMKRIEGMMDKVVEGFEKQLDLLFQGDAMDITADVEVLERMLAMDGLSDRDGLTLNL